MNITYSDWIISRFLNLWNLLSTVNATWKTFRNYRTVLKTQLTQAYPVVGLLRDGKRIMISGNNGVLLLTHHPKTGYALGYNFELDIVRVNDCEIVGGITNGDVPGIFLDGEYERLPVEGKTVLDLGANIGDTLTYFMLRGASRVVGIEPFPHNYALAKINIEANKFGTAAVIRLAACAGKGGSITVDMAQGSTTTKPQDVLEQGHEVPVLTLEQTIQEHAIPAGSVMKMDTEGYEYDIILSTSNEALRKFSHILIEYHHGYKNLKAKLESAGFSVKTDIPRAPHLLRRLAGGKTTTTYLGFLYAYR